MEFQYDPSKTSFKTQLKIQFIEPGQQMKLSYFDAGRKYKSLKCNKNSPDISLNKGGGGLSPRLVTRQLILKDSS